MKVAILLLAIAAVSYGLSAINLDVINRVNTAKTTWSAGVNRNFLNFTKEDARKLMGWTMKPKSERSKNITKPNTNFSAVQLPIMKYETMLDVPDNWNAAQQWP